MENNHLIVFAPYGLNDIFQMIIRPVKIDFTKAQYEKRARKWQKKWSMLKVIPYKEEEGRNK